MPYSDETTLEFEFNSQEDAVNALQDGGELYPYIVEGYTDPVGRQLTKQEMEFLQELGKWIIRLILGIPIP